MTGPLSAPHVDPDRDTRDHTTPPPMYDFTDPITNHTCTLILQPLGVRHGNCPQLADVSPELDAFYCRTCQWNGRISGAWIIDLLERGTPR